MKTNIFILSAADRFNYGDLLFPIVACKELPKHGDFSFHNIGIVKSDLSSIGAIPTMPYKTLYQKQDSNSRSVILVAGGEVIGANWLKLYSFIYPSLHKLFKLISNIERAINKFFPYLKNPLPFVPIDPRISKAYSIIFHGIGGQKAGPKRLKHRIEKTFKQSLYLTARETKTLNAIKNNYNAENITLTPDSAILISDFHTFQKNDESGYISFQVGHYKNGGNLELINQQLADLHKTTKLRIKFLPIGNCSGHDDSISLKCLYQKADYPCEIIHPDHINTIMQTIALSTLHIGTSLHGIITAMSFGVPYLAINPEIPKLRYYLETWAPVSLKQVSPFNLIAKNAIKVLNVPHKDLIDNASFQKNLARESFKLLAEKINNL